jgi:hypothetical protein
MHSSASAAEPPLEEHALDHSHPALAEVKPDLIKLRIKMEQGVAHLEPDHPDPDVGLFLIMERMGIEEPLFFDELLRQLIDGATKDGEVDERKLNFMLAVIAGLEPRDQLEAMLAAQMAAVHAATMTMSRRFDSARNLHQHNHSEKAFNKLARTFTTQMEALNRYRGKGQQKMTVEHVHVHEGGQAIVGNVEGGGGHSK